MSHRQRTTVARAASIVLTALLVLSPLHAAGADEAEDLIRSGNIELLTTLPGPGAIGARFRDDVMYTTSVAGLTTYDVSDPRDPVRLGVLALPHFENEDVDLGGDILLISNDSAESAGILYIVDIGDPASPRLRTVYDLGGNAATAQIFGGPGHTASCVLDCAFAWITDGAGIRVIDLRDPDAPVNLGTYATPAGGGIVSHDVQVDGDGLVWVAGFGGTAAYRLPEGYDGTGLGELVAKTNDQGESTYITELGAGDGSKYNDFIHHNSLRPAGSDVVYITEEDYNRPGCRGAGSFQTWAVNGEVLTPISQWTTELLADTANAAAVCSAHYFDLRHNVVAQGWYEQGLRLLDVSDPANIRQIGYLYTPQTLSWAAYFPPTDPEGRVIYLLDGSHGIDVLEFDRPTEGPLAVPGDDCGNGGGPKEPGKGGKPKKPKKPKKGECATGDGGSSDPGAEDTAPTVEAPILETWRGAAPSLGVADPRFGFACRLLAAPPG